MFLTMLTCPICQVEFKKIDSQHLMKRHGLTREQYLEKYPDGPIGASPLTREKMGSAVKRRGPRSEETRAKISSKLKNNPPERTEAQRAASARNAVVAGKSNIGRKRTVTDQNRRNLSAALKAYYAEHSKPSYKADTDRYMKQLDHIRRLGEQRHEENLHQLKEEIPKLLNHWSQNCEIIIDEQKVKIGVECLACSSRIVRQLGTFKKHSWQSSICHACHPPLKGTSRAEEEIAEFLQGEGFSFQRHVRGLLPDNWELDFYSPDLQVAIEYHGLYWHSGAMDYPKTKHRRKYELCRDRGIHLIQIFEDEWVLKREIVHARILSLLGRSSVRVGARKCQIASITSRVASTFLDAHHLQGGGVRCKFNYALFHKGEVVAVMTFQGRRVAMNQAREDGALELVRFASAGRVPGAFTRLLQHAVKEIGMCKIYSWADLRWTNPLKNVYTAAGFSLHSESSVGYCYTDLVERYHRYGRRKPAGESRTEEQWNSDHGFYQLYDAGTLNYVLSVR